MESCDDIFLNARELADPGERAAYIDQACGNDADLRQRVDAMLLVAEDVKKFFGAEKTVAAAAPGSPARSPIATLRYIGDYELQEEIGRGGMGVVYKARQASLNRAVAVKMIIAGEYAGPDERRRFQREAEAAAQLRHPHIVAIHEVGEHEGRSYFSMDFIEGKTLAAQFKEGKLPSALAASLVKTLAEAVHFAHQRGTLHRDLKPQNILMGADGEPHILDFGLARPVEREAGLTRTGDVMGSPSYMPPEQASGRIGDIGPASDVYSLGAILYEAITGSPPFTGETAMDVLTQVINQDPVPPRKRNPNVTADLETICLKCLEKRPERRYHSARALAEELERFLNFEPILARPAGRLRKGWGWTQRNPWVFAAGLGLAALVLVCVAYGLWEETKILHWRLEAGKEAALPAKNVFLGWDDLGPAPEKTRQAPPTRAESPALLFFLFFPAVCLLLYFVGRGFRSGYRRQVEGGAAVSPRTVLLHAVAGIAAAVVGMGYLLLQIRAWMWQVSSAPFMAMELAGFLCALALNWMGFRMVWEAAGIHETSRYRSLVNKALDQQWAREGRWRLVFTLMAFAWWLYVLALVVIFMISGSSFEARKRDLFAAFAGMFLSAGVTALATWAIRNRRRLFTFVCVPLTLAGYFFAFVALTANIKIVVILLLLYLFSIAQTLVIAPLFMAREKSAAGGPPRFRVAPWLDIVYGLAFAMALFALLHVVENGRGHAALEKCKNALEAKGAKLDWAAFIPPPIPDDQNIFKAPRMEEWFMHKKLPGPGPLGELLNASAPWSGSNSGATSLPLAEIKILPLATNLAFAPGEADLVLRWKWHSLTLLPQRGAIPSASAGNATNEEIVPLVSLDGVPLADAIRALALQANLNIQIDPALRLDAVITSKWKNITCSQCLLALLDNNGLRLADSPGTPVKRVVLKTTSDSIPSRRDATVTNGPDVDVIAFDEVSLDKAIRILARQTELNLMIDSAVGLDTLNATITVRWKHLSAAQALLAIFDNHGLRLIDVPGAPVKRVVRMDLNEHASSESDEVRASLKRVLDQTLGPTMIGPTGHLITQRPLDQTRPAQIVVLCDRMPTISEMEPIFRDYLDKVGSYNPGDTAKMEMAGSNSMSMSANYAGSAETYAAWGEKCEPQFEMVRQALRRPYARMEIDYRNPMELLNQNNWVLRIMTQTLGATAQAYMLRGDPENALRQVTLIHDLRRIMQGPPGGQPEILFSAMINTAVAGLYVGIVQDGLRAQTWREPQLAALQGQLAKIDLPIYLERSFSPERLFMPQLMDIKPSAEMAKLTLSTWYDTQTPKALDWNLVRRNLFFHLAPHGWLDQNKVDIFEAIQPVIEAFDPLHHNVQPRKLDEWENECKLDESSAEFAPYILLRAVAVPRFKRSAQTTCKNQTLVTLARIACALERYRLAHHEYPQSLDALVPQFLDRITPDIIGGQPPVYHRSAEGDFQLSSAGWDEKERWIWPPP